MRRADFDDNEPQLTNVAVRTVESLGLYHVFPGANALWSEFARPGRLSKGKRTWPLDALPVLARLGDCAIAAFAVDGGSAVNGELFEAISVARAACLATVLCARELLPVAICDVLSRRVDAVALEFAPFDDRTAAGRERAHQLRDQLSRLRQAGAWVEVTTPIAAETPRGALLETALSLKAIDGAIPWHLRALPAAAALLPIALDTGSRAGLEYVYAVDAPDHDGEITFCPVCRDVVLIERFMGRPHRFFAGSQRCPRCRTRAHGVFEAAISA